MNNLLEELSDKLIRAKKCWFGHDWTKWENIQVRVVGTKKEYDITHQKRNCLRCNIEKWRRPKD